MRIRGRVMEIREEMKYLGVWLQLGWIFEKHFAEIKEKARGVTRKLTRLMPNIRGPSEGTRRLYHYVITSVVMYGAPLRYRELGKRGELRRTMREPKK